MPFPALFRLRRKSRKRWASQSNIARLCLIKKKIHGGRFWSVRCVTQAKTMSRNLGHSVYVTEHFLLETESEAQRLEPEYVKDNRRKERFAWNKHTWYCVPWTNHFLKQNSYFTNITSVYCKHCWPYFDNTRDSTAESLLITYFTLKSEISGTGPVAGEGKALLMVIHYHLLIKGCTK